MAIPLVAVGGAIKAAILNQVIGQVNGIALNGIVPTSITGSSTGVTVSTNGKITFTNASYVALNGIFSGTYDNYRITWNSTTRSSSGSTQFRMRAAGTDDQTSKYDYVKRVDSGTSGTTSSSSSSTAIPLDQGVAAGQTSDGVIDLFGPALARAVTATCQSTVLSASALTSCQISFANENTTTFDGFSLFILNGGTFTGAVRVYGYNTLN